MKNLVSKPSWDIFCKIVDNFGDIGVCWRLAKQLNIEHGLTVRLWIDDLSAAQKIIPQLNVNLNRQIIDKISLLSWHAETNFTDAADVVIEAFACDLPAKYVSLMAQKKSKWINLEYLSAETWVEDFHAKPSPQANGLTRYFYFPGFSENTGGLIREKNQKLAHRSNKQHSFCKNLDLTTHNHLKVSLFCYPHAPLESLLSAMAESNQPIDCYVPASSILPKIADFFGLNTLNVGEIYSIKSLNLHVLPFLTQTDYDALLAACDVNFVRGEDSWVRAIWAAKPFIWQPYFQEENTHIEKLNAFLHMFYVDFEAKKTVFQVHSDWVEAQLSPAAWQDYLSQLPYIAEYTSQQSQKLTKQADLATRLVDFCNKVA